MSKGSKSVNHRTTKHQFRNGLLSRTIRCFMLLPSVCLGLLRWCMRLHGHRTSGPLWSSPSPPALQEERPRLRCRWLNSRRRLGLGCDGSWFFERFRSLGFTRFRASASGFVGFEAQGAERLSRNSACSRCLAACTAPPRPRIVHFR